MPPRPIAFNAHADAHVHCFLSLYFPISDEAPPWPWVRAALDIVANNQSQFDVVLPVEIAPWLYLSDAKNVRAGCLARGVCVFSGGRPGRAVERHAFAPPPSPPPLHPPRRLAFTGQAF